MKIIIGLLGILLFVLVLIIVIDSNRFHIVKYVIQTNQIDTAFHFVFLSDLHNKVYGKDNQKLLLAIRKLSPDAVLVGGDLLTARKGESLTIALSIIKNLKNEYKIYYANGNHEQRLKLYPETYGDMADRYEEGLRHLGQDRLVNEKVSVAEFSQIEVVGLEMDRKYYKRFHRVNMDQNYIPSILPKKSKDKFTILLAHNPDYINQYAAWGADLVLSGHVHGGIARIPGVGGVISTNFTLFPKYDGGRFEKENTTMIVSRGLGSHTIPWRFLNPGELVDITIEPVSK